MALSNDDEQNTPEVYRKKRLSRTEQKARKKQRKQLQQHQEQSPSSRSNEVQQKEANHSKKSKKKKKKKKSTQTTDKPNDKSSSATPTAPATATPTVDPWEPQALQEDVPYTPTPLPDSIESPKDSTDPQQQQQQQKPSTARANDNNNTTSLGKWFPKARVMKSKPSATDECTILLFYQYKSPVVWGEQRVAALMDYLQAIFEARPTLGGRLRVAPEGINATLSCGDEDGTNARTILHFFTRDLQQFDDVFRHTDFKYIPAKADRHFKDLKILPVQELVFYGLHERQAPLTATGVHLEAKDFHEMLHDTSKETVVIDVRNHYEAALGRFDGQERQTNNNDDETNMKEDGHGESDNNKGKTTSSSSSSSGAKYIDPQMRKSTDWTTWLDKTADDLKGKRVMLYCTGGVRCERASAYLNTTMGDELEGVYQLQGGVEKYLQAFPDGGYWTGRNFVFDKREAVSVENPNGDGGVLPKKKKHAIADGVETKCCVCGISWDRYVGKRKCDTCGVPVMMCDTCMSTRDTKKKNIKKKLADEETDATPNTAKDKGESTRKLVRCDLCVEQNITVPADEVEYTDNGVKSKSHSDHGKAAPSVLKWGGGHAAEKKERRRKQPRNKLAASSTDEPQEG